MKRCIFFLWIIILISCNNGNRKERGHYTFPVKNGNESSYRENNSFINFPDTIREKKWISGELVYSDSISSKTESRYVFFHVFLNKNNKELVLNDVKKLGEVLTFVDKNKDGIITFETGAEYAGRNFLHGVVEIVTYKEDIESDSLIKITKQIMITKPVYVYDTI